MSTVNRRTQRVNLALVIQRQFLKVLIIGMLTFLVLAPFIFLTAKKTYSATVELRIDPSSSSVVTGGESSNLGMYYREYVATQKYKILKRVNIEKALNALDANIRTQLLGTDLVDGMAVDFVERSVTVSPSWGSLILTVSIEGNSPEGLAEIINSLVNVYMEDLKQERNTQALNRMDFSEGQKKDVEKRIADITAELKQISEDISTGNFNSDDIPYKIEVKTQEQTAINAENDRMLKEKKYNDFIKNMYRLSSLGVDAQVETRLAADTYMAEQRKLLMSKIDSLSSQLNNLSAQNAGRKDLEDQISKVQLQITDLENKAREKQKKLIESENSSNMEKMKSALYSDYIIAKEFEDGIKKSFQAAQEKYAYVSKKFLVAKGLQADLDGLKAQLSKINETHTLLVGDQQSSGLVTVESYAKAPTAPDSSSLFKFLAIAFVFSFAWITIVVVTREFLDQRIKSAVELKSATGIKPSWPISQYSGSILNVSLQDRDSVVYKAIQSLATRINQERQNFQVKVVTFCGVNPLTGATEILLNCAHAMIDNCEKILVVDFNFSRPGIAQKLGVPLKAQPAVKNLETAPLESLVFTDLARGFDVLTIRNLDKLENKVIDRVLELARDRYDMIFLDAAPILSSSSTEHLFLQSDSAVFVVRGNLSTYNDLQHTLELVGKFGIESAALVLNWWKVSGKKSSRSHESMNPD